MGVPGSKLNRPVDLGSPMSDDQRKAATDEYQAYFATKMNDDSSQEYYRTIYRARQDKKEGRAPKEDTPSFLAAKAEHDALNASFKATFGVDLDARTSTDKAHARLQAEVTKARTANAAKSAHDSRMMKPTAESTNR
jgi:hypothetical protein